LKDAFFISEISSAFLIPYYATLKMCCLTLSKLVCCTLTAGLSHFGGSVRVSNQIKIKFIDAKGPVGH